jgi:type II secretory pathway component PulC
MLSRKGIYIAISSVLLAGIIIAAGMLFLPGLNMPFGRKIRGSSIKGNGVPADSSGVDYPDSGYSANSSGNTNLSDQSIVMNLLKASNRKESFGSYRVKGIIAHSSMPELSSATIEDTNTGQSRVYKIKEKLPDDSQIVDIKQDHVTLQKSGVRKKIYIFSTGYSGGIKRTTFLENAFSRYKKVSDVEYMLKPYQVFKGDANSILDFSIEVSDKDGRMEGIRISDIKNNALARDLGLKEDDVLLEVNNEPVNSLYKCIKASFNANNSDEIQLKIRRGNKYFYLTYHLYWDGKGLWTPKDILNSKAVSSLFNLKFASHLF